MHEFSHQIFYSIRKLSETHWIGKAWEIDSHTFSIKWGFFPLDSHPVVYFIMWEMHGFSHQFPIAREKAGKPIEWEKPGKLVHKKILQNPLYVENPGNWYSYSSHKYGCFFLIRFTPYGILYNLWNTWEIGKLVPIFSPKYGYFSSLKFPSYGILYHMGNVWLFPSISNSTGKCSKIHPVSSYPKILMKSAATMVFGRKVSQGSNFKKDSQCWGRNYDVQIMNLFHNFIFLTQKCP